MQRHKLLQGSYRKAPRESTLPPCYLIATSEEQSKISHTSGPVDSGGEHLRMERALSS